MDRQRFLPVILSIKIWHGGSFCTYESPLNVICAYARSVITFLKTAYHSSKIKFLPVNEIASLMWKKLKHDEEKTPKLHRREKRYSAPLADVSIMTQGNFRSDKMAKNVNVYARGVVKYFCQNRSVFEIINVSKDVTVRSPALRLSIDFEPDCSDSHFHYMFLSSAVSELSPGLWGY
jgi:hypothetical protein